MTNTYPNRNNPKHERYRCFYSHLLKKKGQFAISRKLALVEAAGIEPASRDVSEQTSTCVFGQLKSHEDTPGRQGVAFTSPEQI